MIHSNIVRFVVWICRKFSREEIEATITELMVAMKYPNAALEPLPCFGTILSRFSSGSTFGERQGNCRRDLLDHVIILNEKHLLRLLEEYVAYYNEDRTHYHLDKDPPVNRPVQKRQSDTDKVIALPRIGGLHHKYVWEKAA